MTSQKLKQKITSFADEKYEGSYRYLKPKLLQTVIGEDGFNYIKGLVSPELHTPSTLMVHCFMQDIFETPLCKCGNKNSFDHNQRKFSKYCSRKCSLSNPEETQRVREETNLKKMGTKNPFSTQEVKEKIKQTYLEKNGVEHYTHTQAYRDLKMTSLEEVLVRFGQVHGSQYGYEKFVYGGKSEKGIVICKEHGEFLTTYQHHVKGTGCPECAGVPRGGWKNKGRESFLEQLKAKFPTIDLDFDKFEYINSTTKSVVSCDLHGEFEKTPKLLLRGQGCPVCSGKSKHTIKTLQSKIDEVHGDGLYDISNSIYVNNKTPIEVVCSLHGSWFVRPDNFIHGETRCPTCADTISKIESE